MLHELQKFNGGFQNYEEDGVNPICDKCSSKRSAWFWCARINSEWVKWFLCVGCKTTLCNSGVAK